MNLIIIIITCISCNIAVKCLASTFAQMFFKTLQGSEHGAGVNREWH